MINQQNRPLIFIIGPTASGKSALAVSLAKALEGEIISADSMQVYQGLDIGTAKVNAAEMQGINHYLLDICPANTNYNVAQFTIDAKLAIEQIYAKQKQPIVAGGTGLYINALLYANNYQDAPPPDWQFREQKLAEAKQWGNEYLHQQLAASDPIAAKRIHANDLKRVIRALEICHQNGAASAAGINKQVLDYPAIIIGLNWPREILYQRIEYRVDLMMQAGFLAEVEQLLNDGLSPASTAMQGLGYRHLAAYLQGLYSYQQAIEHLKRDTRRFAKRQLTWFKRDQNIKWFEASNYNLLQNNQDLLALEADVLAYISSEISTISCK